jgi:hypothetical protein
VISDSRLALKETKADFEKLPEVVANMKTLCKPLLSGNIAGDKCDTSVGAMLEGKEGAGAEKLKLALQKLNSTDPQSLDSMSWLADDAAVQTLAELYRRRHSDQFPLSPSGSYPPTPIELAARLYLRCQQGKTQVLNAFSARDARIADLRSGATLVRQKIAEIDALLARWAGLSQAAKDSIPGMVEAIRRGQGMKKEYELQLQQIEQQWRERSRSEALASLAHLQGQAGDLANMRGHDRRTLVRTAKRLHERGGKVLTKEECAEVAELMTRLRESIGARWWQFWL